MSRPGSGFAPGRVNVIGEHTDYNGGFALPIAIQLGCTATAEPTRDGMIEIRSAQKPTPVRLKVSDLQPGADELAGPARWAGYVAGALWAITDGHPANGWRIEVDSTVPEGAGLSSSAALCVATCVAVADRFGLAVTGIELAEFAQRAESDFAGAPTGGLDQLASVLGIADHAVLCDFGVGRTEPIPFRPEASGLALLVIDTGAPHTHADGEYAERRASCQLAAAQLGLHSLRTATLTDLDRLADELLRRRARHVISENTRVLCVADRLRSGDLAGIGPLLSASHASMRDDFEITVERVDLAVETLLAAGALGARMTGGGFGGSVIALVPAERGATVAGAVATSFARAGFGPVSWFFARPSSGARRLDAAADS